VTVAGQLDQRLAECAARGRRPKTLFSYRQVVRLYLAPALGKVKVGDLCPQHVQRLRDNLLSRELSPTTVRSTRTALHGALELAVQRGMLARNVAKPVKPPAVKRPDLRWPTPEEIGRLLDTAKAAADPLYPLWAVSALGGCRPGELLGLGWATSTGAPARSRSGVTWSRCRASRPSWTSPRRQRGGGRCGCRARRWRP
jgi:integrase